MVARPTAFDKMGDEISLNENVKKVIEKYKPIYLKQSTSPPKYRSITK